ILLSWTQLDAGDLRGALESASAAARLCPRYVLAHHIVGVAFEAFGELAKAERAFVRALKTGDYDPSSIELGQVYLKKKERAKAIDTLDKLIARNPSVSDVYALRAYAHLQARQAQEAAADAEQATSREPTKAETWKVLGDARVLLHDAHG